MQTADAGVHVGGRESWLWQLADQARMGGTLPSTCVVHTYLGDKETPL